MPIVCSNDTAFVEELVWHVFYLVLLAGAAVLKQPEHRGGNCDEQSGTAPSQSPLQSNRS